MTAASALPRSAAALLRRLALLSAFFLSDSLHCPCSFCCCLNLPSARRVVTSLSGPATTIITKTGASQRQHPVRLVFVALLFSQTRGNRGLSLSTLSRHSLQLPVPSPVPRELLVSQISLPVVTLSLCSLLFTSSRPDLSLHLLYSASPALSIPMTTMSTPRRSTSSMLHTQVARRVYRATHDTQ